MLLLRSNVRQHLPVAANDGLAAPSQYVDTRASECTFVRQVAAHGFTIVTGRTRVLPTTKGGPFRLHPMNRGVARPGAYERPTR